MRASVVITSIIVLLAAVFLVTVFKYVSFLENQNQLLLININRDMSKLLAKIETLESGNTIIELYSQNSLLKANNAALEERITQLEVFLKQGEEAVKPAAVPGKKEKTRKEKKKVRVEDAAVGNKGIIGR